MRCPVHGVRLVFDERSRESRPVGGLTWQAEETFVVDRFVCPVEDCREHEERAA